MDGRRAPADRRSTSPCATAPRNVAELRESAPGTAAALRAGARRTDMKRKLATFASAIALAAGLAPAPASACPDVGPEIIPIFVLLAPPALATLAVVGTTTVVVGTGT